MHAGLVVFLRYKVELDFLNDDSLNLSRMRWLHWLPYQAVLGVHGHPCRSLNHVFGALPRANPIIGQGMSVWPLIKSAALCRAA